MSRVLAYAVERVDGKPFPVDPDHFHHSELSPDHMLLWCIDKDDAQACVDYPDPTYGPVRIVSGWIAVTDWSKTA